MQKRNKEGENFYIFMQKSLNKHKNKNKDKGR